MRVYYTTISPRAIATGFLKKDDMNIPLDPLYTIIDDDGNKRYIIRKTKLYNSRDDLIIELFTSSYKKLSFEQIVEIYNLNDDEAKKNWNKSLDLFPEKFI